MSVSQRISEPAFTAIEFGVVRCCSVEFLAGRSCHAAETGVRIPKVTISNVIAISATRPLIEGSEFVMES